MREITKKDSIFYLHDSKFHHENVKNPNDSFGQLH